MTTSTLIQFDVNRMRYLIVEPASMLSYAAPGLRQELKRKCKRTKDKLAGDASWPK